MLELKDGGIGTNTQSEGEDGDEGETGTETKKPESMAKVAPERCPSIPWVYQTTGGDECHVV